MPGHGLIGIFCLIGIAWTLSENRTAIRLKLVGVGLGLQAGLAIALLQLPPVREIFLLLARAVEAVAAATQAGTSFVFGYIGGGPTPFDVAHPQFSFVLAFQALPMVLVITALSALLYHWRILPWVIEGLAIPLRRFLNVGGATGLSAAAMPFLGMVESPLMIRPYLADMPRADLFLLMVGGMSTIAGTMLVLYSTFLAPVIPNPIAHLLTASLISIPAAVTIARIMIPVEVSPASDTTATTPQPLPPTHYQGAIDALMGGTMDGVRILTGIVAVLLVAVAMVHLIDGFLGLLPDVANAPLSLQRLMGWAMAPVAWSIGIDWADAVTAGSLLGTKLVLNEMIAYFNLAQLNSDSLTPHTRLILTYALCGFSNIGSMGILIGGLSAMSPNRRTDFIQLAPRAMLAGILTSCVSGALIGLFI